MFKLHNHHQGNATHIVASWQPLYLAISKIRRGKKNTNLACHAEKLLGPQAQRAVELRLYPCHQHYIVCIKLTQECDIAEEATNGALQLVNNKYNSSRILKARKEEGRKV